MIDDSLCSSVVYVDKTKVALMIKAKIGTTCMWFDLVCLFI